MSIFTKLFLLFLASFALMFFVAKETNQLTQAKMESLLKEKYLQASNELFKDLANNDEASLAKKVQALGFEMVSNANNVENEIVVYEQKSSFGAIKIVKDSHDETILVMTYLDEVIRVKAKDQAEYLEDHNKVGYLIYADIAVLVMIFLMIAKLLFPLKKMTHILQRFGEGDLHVRMSPEGSNELGKLVDTFNAMASNIEALVHSRQQLLRDIGHELRTPLAKSKLALEMMPHNAHQKLLQKAICQIDMLTNELLQIERINANMEELNVQHFNVETLISEALSKLMIEDESLIDMSIHQSFDIEGDLNYLAIALKNLIDNALKYTTRAPIKVEVSENVLHVKSYGKALEQPLAYYCEPFAQGDDTRNTQGFGLGLNIVQKILAKQQFKLTLSYDEGYNTFSIFFK